jgi:hypothetical protein
VYADGSQTVTHGGNGGREEIFVLGKGNVHQPASTPCLLSHANWLEADEAVIVSLHRHGHVKYLGTD